MDWLTAHIVKLASRLTTEQRDKLRPAKGDVIRNTDTKTIQTWTGSQWADLGEDWLPREP